MWLIPSLETKIRGPKILPRASTFAILFATTLALPPPLAEFTDDNLIITSTEHLPSGATLTVYGTNPSSNITVPDDVTNNPVGPRCGSNAVTCYGNHVPALATCNELGN
ncbi:hypothetical protein VTI74DRAFT_647 [Chaetomium olivicolor]